MNAEMVGRWVKYTNGSGKDEYGRIKSWNSRYIFVVFNCDNKWDKFQDYTGCAVNPEDLVLMPKEFTL